MAATVRRGSTGPDVAALQRALGIPADGVFGPQTEGAVRAYQQSHGLAVDGIAGPQTWGAIGGGGGAPAGAAPKPAPPDLGPDLNYQFQHAKAQLQFDYAAAATKYNSDVTLSQRQRNEAVAALNFERDTKLRALNERFTQALRVQPEQFAARGLYRSGLMLTKLNELQSDQSKQARDISQTTDFNAQAVHQKYLDTLKQLQDNLKAQGSAKNFGLNELGLSKAAKQAQLASELKAING